MFKNKIIFLLIFSFFFQGNYSFAQEENQTPIVLQSESALLYDMRENKIIYEKNIDESYPIASLTKIMTMLIASEEVELGKVKIEEKMKVSETAWRTKGSSMFLEVGQEVSFEELMNGLGIVSGNDAAVVLAERIAGTTDRFVERMNEKTKELNMKDTNFVTVNGLPVSADKRDMSTARDVLTLTKEYITKFPNNFEYHNKENFSYDNGKKVIEQSNRNLLLGKYEGVDGLKTGFISKHYNFIVTAKKGEVRFIAILLKAPSENVRAVEAEKLLDYGFSKYTEVEFGNKSDVVRNMTVYKSQNIKKTEVILESDVHLVIKKEDEEFLKVIEDLPLYIVGGQNKGDIIGTKNIYIGDDLIHSTNIVLSEDLPLADFLTRIFDSIAMFLNWFLNRLF